jgi:hypothetical protein
MQLLFPRKELQYILFTLNMGVTGATSLSLEIKF